MSIDEHANRMLTGIMDDITDMKERLRIVSLAVEKASEVARDASKDAASAVAGVVKVEESIDTVKDVTASLNVRMSVIETCISGFDKILSKNVVVMENMQLLLSDFSTKISANKIYTGITWTLLIIVLGSVLTLAWKLIEKGAV